MPSPKKGNKNIRVAVIGTCRARDLLHDSYSTKEERLSPKYKSLCDVVWYRFSSFTHTPLQAIQYYKIFRNGLKIPNDLQMLIFSKKLDEKNLAKISEVTDELLDSIDMYVIEISTRNNFECNGFYLNSNYTENNFIRSGGKTMLKWWRSVSKNSKNHSEVIEETIDEIKKDTPSLSKGIISILKNTKKFVQTPEELIVSLKELIKEINKPTIVVPIFNVPGNLIKSRSEISNLLLKHSSTIGYNFYDPTGVLNKVGREKALASNGTDINHYSEKFHHEVGKEFVSFVNKAYENNLKNDKILIEKFENNN